MLKVFDSEMASRWHSGSCTSFYVKHGFESKEAAEEWMYEARYTKYRSAGYQVTECVLCYDEAQSDNVEAMFKYMSL